MSHVIDRRPTTGDTGSQPPDIGRARRLAVAIVALGLLLGAITGWAAFTMFEPPGPSERSLDAQQARWEGAAEKALERAEAEAHRLDVERRRWEAKADHYAPGWRER